MRVQCPHCKQFVTLPNEKAEQSVACPGCGQIFDAPALMHALPDEPAPPPVRQYSPPVTPTPPPSSTYSRPATSLSALETCCQLQISKNGVKWIGPVALGLLFCLSFMTWIAAAPNAQPVYTQSAWGVIGGTFTTDITGEKVLNREAELKGQSAAGWLMLFAMLILIPAVLIAIGHLVDRFHKVTVPDIISHLWPMRLAVLAGAAAGIFLLLSLQLVTGFGLESAAKTMAEKKFIPTSDTETTEAGMTRSFRQAEEVSRLGLRRSGWLWLAYLTSAVAAIGFGLELALEQRGARPEPSIEFKW